MITKRIIDFKKLKSIVHHAPIVYACTRVALCIVSSLCKNIHRVDKWSTGLVEAMRTDPQPEVDSRLWSHARPYSFDPT